MASLNQWASFFTANGFTCQEIPGNSSAMQLTNVAGSPIFRCAKDAKELESLHTKARSKSSEINRILIIALPIDHAKSSIAMPGDILLPRFRVYAGNIGDTFSLSGHGIESEFLQNIKKETLEIMSSGNGVKTPLCDWVIKVLGTCWHYGKPSSLAELDSMLGLMANEVGRIGHIRSRQLSFGRGCSEATFLPIVGTNLKNNDLNQQINKADFRLISLEQEMGNYSPARQRIYPIITHRFLSVMSAANRKQAKEMGCEASIGTSTLGKVLKMEVKVDSVDTSLSSV